MKTPRLKADIEGGIGGVEFPADWREHSRILRADLLKDWITELNVEYGAALDEELAAWEAARAQKQ